VRESAVQGRYICRYSTQQPYFSSTEGLPRGCSADFIKSGIPQRRNKDKNFAFY
jgi:hypothetical protein